MCLLGHDRAVQDHVKRKRVVERHYVWWLNRLVAGVVGILGTVSVVAYASTDDAETDSVLVVGSIEIVGEEVFDSSGSGVFAPYRIANNIHVRTRERVIRRELLFSTGDVVDRELIEQTERNLRSLSFLRDARVELFEVDNDMDGVPDQVDIRVTTWDRWTLSPRLDFEQVHDKTKWELGVSEKNLFGFGKAITLSRRVNLDRRIDRVYYQDPQLLGSKIGLIAGLSNFSDGNQKFFVLNRGFLSLRDPWAVSVRAGNFSLTQPIIESGVEIDRLPHSGRWGDMEVGRALSRGASHALRMHGAFRVREEFVGTQRRDFGIAEVGVRFITHQFVRLAHVNQFERTEDFNLGSEAYGTIGLSTRILGGQGGQVAFLSAGHRRGLVFRDDHFVVLGVSFAGRRERGTWRNTRTSMSGRYLLKQTPRAALIGKFDYDHGYNLDPEVQLRLGTDSGLRGYPNRQFNGTRSLLMTAEERWFVADDVWQLLSFGVAVFVDAGFAWPEDMAVDLSDLKTAVGVSLLVGSNRLASRGGVRFDLGYGLNPALGRSHWVGAAFSDVTF